MALKDEELAEDAHERWMAELLRRTPLEKRLAELTPEQRMTGIPPEQRMTGIPPEQRLLALPDDALAAFPDDYLHSLSPETQAAIRLRIGRPS